MNKVKHFVIRNLVRGWPTRILHLTFTLLLLIIVAILGQDLQLQLNVTIADLFDINYWNSLLSTPQASILSTVAVLSILNFNLAWVLRRTNVTVLIFTVFALLTNLVGLAMEYRAGMVWPYFESNLLIGANFIYTLLQVMMSFERENDFVKQAFGRYINPEVLENLITSPKKLDLGGEQKNMTVLFSDLRGFTTISEKLPPKQLVKLLNKYFDEMSQVVVDQKGTIDKYIGDAIMAFWGAPLNNSAHATYAVQTAMKMLDALEDLKSRHPEFKDIKMGIGINSGNMVVGNLGSHYRFDYTVLGDNVNLGSRLEGLTKRYGLGLVISESTLQSMTSNPDGFIFRMVDEIVVKGKTKPIKIYQPMYNNQYTQQLKQQYETAFYYYQNKYYDQASQLFFELAQQGDSPSQVMLDRINLVRNWEDFNGVWTWQGK